MTKQRKVGLVVGSIRKDSLNRKIANALVKAAPEDLDIGFVEIGDLPLYNQDLDDNPPAPWTRFRDELAGVDAVLFVTPEHNRSIPAAMKNALDVGSRPYGASVWDGKPGGVVTGSPGAMGGFGSNHHLRQSAVFLNIPMMAQPEMYLGGIGDLFDEHGEITSERTKGFLSKFMTAYAAWVHKQLGD